MVNSMTMSKYLLICILALGLVACADEKAEDKTPEAAIKTEKEEAKVPGQDTEAYKLSTEMTATFDGKYETVEAAAKKYGVPGLNTENFAEYDLKEAKILSCAGECCKVDVKAGLTVRSYEFCWKDGKLQEVKFIKMQ